MTALLQGINTAANIKSKRVETKRLQAESRARLSSEGYDEQGYRVEGGLADVQADLYTSIGKQHDILESNAELKNKQQAQKIQALTAQTHQLQKDQMLYLSDKALTETISPLTQNGNIDPAPLNLLLRSNDKVREVFLQKFGISGFTEFIPTSQEHKQAAINDGLISNEATDEQLAEIQKNYMVSYGPDGKLDTKSGHELAIITGLNPKRMVPKVANAYNEIYSNANILLASTENINPNDLKSEVPSNPVKDNSQELAQVQKSLSGVIADSNKTAEEKIAQIGSMVAALKGAYDLKDLASINTGKALASIKASDKGEDTRSAKERGVDRQTNFRNGIRKAAKKAGTPFPEYVLNPENKYEADLITGIKNWSPKLTDEQLKQIDFSGRIAALGGAAINLETYETGIINANIKRIQKYVRLYKGGGGGQVSIKAFNKLLNTFMVKALGSQQTKIEIENYKRTIGDDRNTRASIFGGLYLAIKNEKTSLENLMRSLPSPEYAAATTLPTTLKKYNVLLTELVVELKDLGEAVEKNVYDVDNSETPTEAKNKDQPTFSGARDNFQTKSKSKSKSKTEPKSVSANTVDKRVANKLKSGGF